MPAPSGALAFDIIIFSRSHDLFASSRSCYSSFDFTHVVYRFHRVAALKIMYFRGGVGPPGPFFLRSPRVSFRRLPPSLHRFSFLSRSSLIPFSPSTRKPRCNNGCPLIIGRPRHFKKIPRAHHGIPFRSLLKISLPPSLSSLRSLVSSFSEASEMSVTKTINVAIVARGKLVSSRESTYREFATAVWSFAGSFGRALYGMREMMEIIKIFNTNILE